MEPALPDLPSPIFLRRWFSIQNSQLVYQKKLKVFWGTGSLLGKPHLDYGPGCLEDIGTGLRMQTGTESKRSGGAGREFETHCLSLR